MHDVFPQVAKGVVLRELDQPDTIWVRTSDAKTVRTSVQLAAEMGNVKVYNHTVVKTRLRAGLSVVIDNVIEWRPISTDGLDQTVIAVCTTHQGDYELHTVWSSTNIRVIKAVPAGSGPQSVGNIILAGKRMPYVER